MKIRHMDQSVMAGQAELNSNEKAKTTGDGEKKETPKTVNDTSEEDFDFSSDDEEEGKEEKKREEKKKGTELKTTEKKIRMVDKIMSRMETLHRDTENCQALIFVVICFIIIILLGIMYGMDHRWKLQTFQVQGIQNSIDLFTHKAPSVVSLDELRNVTDAQVQQYFRFNSLLNDMEEKIKYIDKIATGGGALFIMLLTMSLSTLFCVPQHEEIRQALKEELREMKFELTKMKFVSNPVKTTRSKSKNNTNTPSKVKQSKKEPKPLARASPIKK